MNGTMRFLGKYVCPILALIELAAIFYRGINLGRILAFVSCTLASIIWRIE